MLSGPLAILMSVLTSLADVGGPISEPGCHELISPITADQTESFIDVGAIPVPVDERLCLGDRVDEPGCRVDEPASTPPYRVSVSSDFVRALATATPFVPSPAASRCPVACDDARPTHPGYARRVDRPPRA